MHKGPENTSGRRALPALAGALVLLIFWPLMAHADWWALNMPVGVTETSAEIFDLHMLIFIICIFIGAGVFGVMLVSILLHRKSYGVTPASFHESTTLEILWTIVPFLILVAMAIPATYSLGNLYNADDAELDIEVRGYQWKWQYTYLDETDPDKQLSFFSNLLTSRDEIYDRKPKGEYYLLDVDNPVVIPTGKKVRFLITANDVIHAWWVPDLAVKKDAVPGFMHEAWTKVDKPGIYRGQCAELCGKDHGFMPIVVHAVPPAEYETWLTEKKEAQGNIDLSHMSMDVQMEEGEAVYNAYCATCHLPNGQGIPPAFPSLIGSPVTIGPLEEHLDLIINGKPGTAMQAFRQQLTPRQLAAVTTYERNAWGNSTGDMAQANEVQALMDAGR